jgi:hypothetical protein
MYFDDESMLALGMAFGYLEPPVNGGPNRSDPYEVVKHAIDQKDFSETKPAKVDLPALNTQTIRPGVPYYDARTKANMIWGKDSSLGTTILKAKDTINREYINL